jgi:hypothetical protein
MTLNNFLIAISCVNWTKLTFGVYCDSSGSEYEVNSYEELKEILGDGEGFDKYEFYIRKLY